MEKNLTEWLQTYIKHNKYFDLEKDEKCNILATKMVCEVPIFEKRFLKKFKNTNNDAFSKYIIVRLYADIRVNLTTYFKREYRWERYLFNFMCRSNNIHCVKWVDNYFPDIKDIIYEGIDFSCRYSCFEGYFDVVEWLIINVPNLNVYLFDENKEYNEERDGGRNILSLLCAWGKIKLGKKLLDKYPEYNIEVYNHHALRYACEYKQKATIEWLYSLNNKYSNTIESTETTESTDKYQYDINNEINNEINDK